MAEEIVVVSQTPNIVSNPQGFLDAIVMGLNNTLMDITTLIPNLIAAVILVVIGWAVGSLFAILLKRVLDAIKLEQFLQAHKVEDSLGNVKVSKVIVQIVKYYIILIFLTAAVGMVSFGPLTTFLLEVVMYAPKIIAAVIVLVTAAILGELVREKFMEVHEKEDYMKLLGAAAKYFMLFIGLVISLDTLGLPTDIIKETFKTMLQALGFAFALAVGLAFGFGGQESAKDWLKEWRKRLHI
jgi:hypothetical protein